MSDKKNINNVNCCVYGCHTKKGREKHLSFHHFPKEKANCVFITNKYGYEEKMDRNKAWKKILLMGKPPTAYMRVCSLHFKKSDYILPDVPTTKPRLKKTAVPSENLPKKFFEKNHSQRRVLTRHTTNNEEFINEEEPVENSVMTTENCEGNKGLTEKEKIAIAALLQLMNCSLPSRLVDQATQVKSGDLLIPFVTGIDTDAKLNTFTGLHSVELLSNILKIYTQHFPASRKGKLSPKDKILLTFMKMKTGFRYVILAALFGVTSKTCKVIFHDTISKLAVILKPAIYFPSLEENQRSLPQCFRPFPNVRVVLDCTEIAVQATKLLCCRIKCYSHYKGDQTIKFMTGVTPAGFISFVSRAYGGRASDNAIFEQSNIIDLLEKGRDAVMVDKGFRIDEITGRNYIKLIRPPFLKQKAQLSEHEAKSNIEIARARVHIERVNQRIKIFEIFNKPLLWSLVPKVEDMFNVACAVVNSSAPVLSDDKFLK